MRKFLILLLLILVAEASYSQNNCPSTPVCTGFSDTPNGIGVQELNGTNNGCLSVEHNSTWITVTILTSGTLQFTINPNVNSNDFDFAVWGPGSGCPPTSNPIRCSWAAGGGNTGVNTSLNVTGANNTEGAAGDGWVNNIAVTAGETYLILIDNFTTNSGFDMTFGGTSTLDCITLPIELTEFYCYDEGSVNYIKWVTKSEVNNDYFILEKSDDGMSWTDLVKIDGAGNSPSITKYSYADVEPYISYTYYRLKQVDYDGVYEYSDVIYVQNKSTVFYTYTVYPTDGFIHLSNSYFFEVYNSVGQIVISKEDDKIDVGGLSKGIYIIKIGGYTQKVII